MNQGPDQRTHTSADSAPLLRVRDLSLQIENVSLLKQVSLSVQKGELVGLIGPNGAGKSTLLSIMAGLQRASQGEIELAGRRLDTWSLRERTRKIAWLEQAGQIHWPLSVERVVALGRRPHLGLRQALGEQDRAVVESALQATHCTDLRERSVNTLSGGEKARVLLARALVGTPELLLADEPVAALDPAHQLQTMAQLRQFCDNEHGCVVVLHDLSLAMRYCHRLLLLHQGSLVAAGTPTAVLSDENLLQVYGIEVLRGQQEFPWLVPVKVANRASS